MLKTFAFLALLCAAGCGGGGSSHAAPVPLPNATSSPTKNTTGSGNVSFSFTIPRRKRGSTHGRRPSFISPGAVSVGVTINGAQTTTSDLGVNAPGCVANGTTEIDCTVSAQAPNGNDSFDVKLYDAAGGGGHLLSEGTASTWVDGTPQQIPVIMNPYVASVQLALPQPPAGDCGVGQLDTSQPLPLTVSAYDASGALITPPGTFQNPITLTNSDSSGAATLSQTTVADATAAPTLTFTGIDYTIPVTISAVANGVAAAQITPATLNLGADRPLINLSQSTYSVTSPTLSGAIESWTVLKGAAYPSTPYPNVVTIPPSPANVCQLHISNPAIADAARDGGDASLADLYLVDTNQMQSDDLYVTTQSSGGTTNTLLWLSQSTGWQQNEVSAALKYSTVITLFQLPTIVGALPRPSSLSMQPSFDTFFGDTGLTYLGDGTLTTEDIVREIKYANGQDAFGAFTAIPSGSPYTTTGQTSPGTLPPLMVTDLGVGTIPPECVVGPGVPTQGVHLLYAGGTGYLDRIRQVRGMGRSTSALRPSNAAGTTEEWVRRDVGVICRRQNRAFGNVVALQSYQPGPLR